MLEARRIDLHSGCLDLKDSAAEQNCRTATADRSQVEEIKVELSRLSQNRTS